MKQCIDIFTAVYTDNKEKKYKGTGYGAIVVTKTKRRSFSEYNPNTTYLQMWMEETSSLLEQLIGGDTIHDFESLVIGLHTYESNTGRILEKIKKVFVQMKDYEEDSWDVVELKLRRSNKTYYPYHDAMVQIVFLLLNYNKHTPVQLVLFTQKKKNIPEMTLALQKAEAAVQAA